MDSETRYLPAAEAPGHEALWLWFGLSRAGWLTLPRVLLHEMPDDWQQRLADLLTEYDAAFPNQPDVTTQVHVLENNRFTRDYRWLGNYRHPDHARIQALRPAPEVTVA